MPATILLPNSLPRFLWHVLAIMLTLAPGIAVGEGHGNNNFNRPAASTTKGNSTTGENGVITAVSATRGGGGETYFIITTGN